MTATNEVQKTLGEQMADLLRRKPKNFDVVFSVGPEKIKVEAVKFVLKAASPVFETEFDDNWENAVVREGEGIPLLNFDPIAFQLFVNLLILDAWSLVSLNALKLSPNNLLSLLGLCRHYKITKAIKNLEEAAHDFIQSFDKHKDTDEFLKISRENLETIFSFEKFPLDENEIFQCCCRWASNQCTIKGLEPTGENYREVLGGCLFQIRFPSMSNEEFTKVCFFKKNVLKRDEQLDILLFIGLSIDEKTNFDKTQLQFKTNPRVANQDPTFGCLVLSLPQQYKLTTSPSFMCYGSIAYGPFQVSQKIALHGIGFLRPIVGDTDFDVTVQILRYVGCNQIYDSGKFKKNIFAQKGKIFYFLFDEPVTIEPTSYDSSWQSCYRIDSWLKGSNNIAQYKVDNPKHESFVSSGVEFHLSDYWNYESPLAGLLYRKI